MAPGPNSRTKCGSNLAVLVAKAGRILCADPESFSATWLTSRASRVITSLTRMDRGRVEGTERSVCGSNLGKILERASEDYSLGSGSG